MWVGEWVGYKKQYIEGNCLKRGVWAVCRFKGEGLTKKRGVVFLRGDQPPNAHYDSNGQTNCLSV